MEAPSGDMQKKCRQKRLLGGLVVDGLPIDVCRKRKERATRKVVVAADAGWRAVLRAALMRVRLLAGDSLQQHPLQRRGTATLKPDLSSAGMSLGFG